MTNVLNLSDAPIYALVRKMDVDMYPPPCQAYYCVSLSIVFCSFVRSLGLLELRVFFSWGSPFLAAQ